MILFWTICAAMTAVAVAFLLWPLLRRRDAEPAANEAGSDLAVYRDQLGEIERDRARGLLDDDQAEAARLEVERRILGVADRAERDGSDPRRQGAPGRGLAFLVAALLPLMALGVYAGLGAPGEPAQPLAGRQGVAPPGDIAEMAGSLAARLSEGGGSAEDWILLARTYAQLGRAAQAADAAGQAIRLGMEDAETYSFRGEMLTSAAQGEVTQEARTAFGEALERDRGNPRALYYAGLALAQDRQLQPALRLWTTLAEASPPDAPWLGLLRQQIRQVAADLGLEPPAIAAEGGEAPGAPGGRAVAGDAPGPSQADIAAAQDMTSDERMAFIRSMVDRLATRLEDKPDDLDGWLRLTRAYIVLQEADKAEAALDRAEALVEPLAEDAPERAAVDEARRALAAGG